MNPMEMMQFAKELDNFKKNKQKVANEFGKGLPEGSILELKITRPGQEEKVSNMRILPEDQSFLSKLMQS